MLKRVKEKVPKFEADTEGDICIWKHEISVKSVPLQHIPARNWYQNYSRVEKLLHTSVVDIIVHFRHVELPWAVM